MDFEARQGKEVLDKKEMTRSLSLPIKSASKEDIDLCWKKKDRKSKKLDFSFKRNLGHSKDQADTNTLDSLTEDLQLLQGELEDISRNIQKQKDLEEEHFNLALSAASTQTWMSILKMLMVIGICVVQIYLITSYFSGNQNKRH